MTPTATQNEQRAERAYDVLLIYAQRVNGDASDVETNAVDLMADLLHLLDLQYGLEPEDAQRMAWHHFVAEKAEDA